MLFATAEWSEKKRIEMSCLVEDDRPYGPLSYWKKEVAQGVEPQGNRVPFPLPYQELGKNLAAGRDEQIKKKKDRITRATNATITEARLKGVSPPPPPQKGEEIGFLLSKRVKQRRTGVDQGGGEHSEKKSSAFKGRTPLKNYRTEKLLFNS